MKEDYQIDLEYVKSRFESELEGIDVEVAHREIGNGPQFAIKASRQDSTVELWESQWYSQEEFEAFCEGMKAVEQLFWRADIERSDD